MKPRLTAADAFYIGLGGLFGSLLRWWIGLGFAGSFPVPTLFANILGAVALGIFYGIQHRMHPQGKYLYMVGFCGSFTTVSLFTFETMEILRTGDWATAVLYLALPVGISLLVLAGMIPLLEKLAQRRHP